MLDADQRAGRTALPLDLPVGNQLIASFVARINALDEPGKQAMAVVAAAIDTTAGDIHDAVSRFVDGSAGLAAGEVAGIVRSTPDAVEVTHPLMRTAIRDAVGRGRDACRNAASAQVVADADKRGVASSLRQPSGRTRQWQRSSNRLRLLPTAAARGLPRRRPGNVQPGCQTRWINGIVACWPQEPLGGTWPIRSEPSPCSTKWWRCATTHWCAATPSASAPKVSPG